MKKCNHYIIKNKRYIPTIVFLPEADKSDKSITDVKHPSKVCYCKQCGYILHDSDYNRLCNLIKYKNKFRDKLIETPLDKAYIDNYDIANMVAPVPGEYHTDMDKENLYKTMISPEPKYPSFYENIYNNKFKEKYTHEIAEIKTLEPVKIYDNRLTNTMNEMYNGNRDVINQYLKQDDSTLKYNDGSCPCDNYGNCTCCKFKD